MEATKPPKPPMKRVALGDPASRQAVTKVNAEQASKRIMQELTRRTFRGKPQSMGERGYTPRSDRTSGPTGVVATACCTGDPTQHGKPRAAGRGQPGAREGQTGPPGVAERPVVPMKPGNAGGGKGPEFKDRARRGKEPGDWR